MTWARLPETSTVEASGIQVAGDLGKVSAGQPRSGEESI